MVPALRILRHALTAAESVIRATDSFGSKLPLGIIKSGLQCFQNTGRARLTARTGAVNAELIGANMVMLTFGWARLFVYPLFCTANTAVSAKKVACQVRAGPFLRLVADKDVYASC